MSSPIYRFKDYRLDPARREFWRGDVLVPLQLKSFDCLAYLIEHRDRAVGRDELISAVWGKADLNGSLLRQTILQVRRAFQNDESARDAVQTIPNFGYRWNLETCAESRTAAPPRVSVDSRESGDDVSIAGVATVPPGPSERIPAARVWRRAMWLPILPALLVLVGAWGYFNTAPEPAGVSAQGNDSRCANGERSADVAAVLPVRIDLQDDKLSWVRLGLMESIANRLGKGGQRVVPSEDIIALSANGADELPRVVRNVICARYQVASHAQRSGADWSVHLVLTDIDGGEREVEAQHAELVMAARNASDHLLVMLGRPTPTELKGGDSAEVEELLARIHIALFTNDLDTAARLIDSASPSLRSSREFRWKELDLLSRRGDFDHVLKRLQAMVEEPAIRDHPADHARVLTALALVEVRRLQPEMALGFLNQAMPSLSAPEQIGQLGSAYNIRGLAHTMLGRYDEAGTDFATARHSFAATGHVVGLMMVDSNDGMLLLSRNRPAEALPLLTLSAERAERLGRQESLAFAAGFIGSAHLSLLQPAKALAAFDRFEPRVEHKNESYPWCQYRYYRARALMAAGRLAEAHRILDENRTSAIDYCRDDGLPQVAIAGLFLMEGETDKALAQARRAVEALTQPDVARERAEAWLVAVRCLQAISPSGPVVEEIQRFSDWAEQLKDPGARVHALLARAEQSWSGQRFDQAGPLYEEALRLARTEGVPADLSLVASSYGHALIAAGNPNQAGRVAAQVARWSDSDFDSAVLLAAAHQMLDQREQWQLYLNQSRLLAGERSIPAVLMEFPPPRRTLSLPAQ